MQVTLSRKVLASYSAASLPIAAMAMPIAVYLPPFYGEGLGLSLTTVGLIFTAARVWDVITDPVMGLLIDRFETRWGRRKHWVALALPLLMLAVYMVFLPDPQHVSAGYLAGWLLVLYIGYTMLAIAHQSWGAELATSYDERSRLFAWREIFVIGGMTLVLAIPAFVELGGHSDTSAKVASMGLFCLIVFPLATLPTLLFVPDRSSSSLTAKVDWRAAFAMLAGDRNLWRVLGTDLTTGFAATASGALYIFFAVYVFELPEHASLALLLYFLASFLAMPLWLKAALRFGKDRTIRFALLYGASIKTAIFFLAEPGEVVLFWSYTLIYGIAYGAAPTLLRSMMADLTDVDRLRTGKQRAGLYFALLTTTNKLGGALAVGIVLTLVESAFGFAPGSSNSAEAVDGLKLVYCAAPGIALLLAYLPMIRYPLDRAAHAQVQAALERT